LTGRKTFVHIKYFVEIKAVVGAAFASAASFWQSQSRKLIADPDPLKVQLPEAFITLAYYIGNNNSYENFHPYNKFY
jgi:hypothetical protein